MNITCAKTSGIAVTKPRAVAKSAKPIEPACSDTPPCASWIEIENEKSYTVGFAERKKNQATKFDTQDKLIAYLQGEIKKGQGFKEITVYAPGDISAGTIRTLVTSIEKSFGKDEISKIHLGVTGKK